MLVATSGAAALKMMAEEEISGQLALIITDHLMPGMHGPEFVRRLREKMPEIPVVVLSGFPDAEREYRSAHVEFYLKPVPPETLIRVVNELLDGTVAQSA